MFNMRSELPAAPWDDWVERVIIHVPHYLSSRGVPTSGGRQRKVHDIARLITSGWGRKCLVVQKGIRSWQAEDSQGVPVIGIKARQDVYGDPAFARSSASLVGRGDAMLYLGGEDAWPFFVNGAKAIHVGVWWDGPFPRYKKAVTSIRTEALFRSCRSVYCVDTNVINWLRARSRRNQDAANRAHYIHNCVDLEQLPVSTRSGPETPLRLLFARRFEYKRGPDLALDAVALLAARGLQVRLLMATAVGQAGKHEVLAGARRRGIEDIVEYFEEDIRSVFHLYQSADVALVPTLWSEGTSYSCVEALAAGLPVVTTTVGGLPNIVVPGFNGYVVRPTVEPYADAIESLANRETWHGMHLNCLSMRGALSRTHWERRVLAWMKE